jgi:hypothetical protein
MWGPHAVTSVAKASCWARFYSPYPMRCVACGGRRPRTGTPPGAAPSRDRSRERHDSRHTTKTTSRIQDATAGLSAQRSVRETAPARSRPRSRLATTVHFVSVSGDLCCSALLVHVLVVGPPRAPAGTAVGAPSNNANKGVKECIPIDPCMRLSTRVGAPSQTLIMICPRRKGRPNA